MMPIPSSVEGDGESRAGKKFLGLREGTEGQEREGGDEGRRRLLKGIVFDVDGTLW